MKRLSLLIIIFCVALSAPLIYFIHHSLQGLEQEELGELRFFAETLFDEIENELVVLVHTEEQRPIEEYNASFAPNSLNHVIADLSPLSRPPEADYIIGYLQNGPEGDFSTPLADTGLNEVNQAEKIPTHYSEIVSQLREVNQMFNQLRKNEKKIRPYTPPIQPEAEEESIETESKSISAKSVADKYLNISRTRKTKDHLGAEKRQVQKITQDQAVRITGYATEERWAPQASEPVEAEIYPQKSEEEAQFQAQKESEPAGINVLPQSVVTPETSKETFGADDKIQVEVAPLQSVFVGADKMFVFRRIAINNRIFRQGFVINLPAFLRYLANSHFIDQPMAQFTSLRLRIENHNGKTISHSAGIRVDKPRFNLDRRFPRPFAFLEAELVCRQPPRSASRQTLMVMIGIVSGVVLIGMLAIYQSARTVMDLSYKRANFVSSVTHELKTPLTNIRMYIEMLEQGIARTREREMDYYRILSSETTRLSRLINNVLEFSKLENKKRRFDMHVGDLSDVAFEVREIMREKLRHEGFDLEIHIDKEITFKYDREAMVQVLLNLVENSIKFGKNQLEKRIGIRTCSETRRNKVYAVIKVSDAGPGIPSHSLKKIFNDFYRGEDPIIKHTQGTGIGLALVKKLVIHQGGSIIAQNNASSGCTISIRFPI